MKLRRLELIEFKRFRDGCVLDDIAPGLNIVVGANEAGKSTIATALRAAFLERFKTTRVADFAPEGLAQARPTVIVDFDVGDTAYHLSKTFLHRPRCELRVGDRRLEGEQAEDTLAGLLGFDYPLKGQSKPTHAGVPGLLWITQGSSQSLAEPAQHAGTHLRDALTRLSGELIATDGDRLFQRVADARSQVLDARNGRPKGRFREVADALEQAQQSCATLAGQKATWEGDVDRLAELRKAHAADAAEAPWVAFEQRAAQARAQLAVLAREREALDAAQTRVEQARATVALLAEHVARDQADVQKMHELVTQRAQAEALAAQAAAREQAARAAVQQAEAAATAAAARLALAQRQQDQQERHERLTQARQTLQVLTQKSEAAQAQALTARHLGEQARRLAFSREDVKRLQALATRQMQWQARAQTAATRVDYTLLPGQVMHVGDHALTGHGEHLVLSAQELHIDGVGRLRIVPGGEDLAHVAGELASVTQAFEAMCARLDVADVEQAEARALASERAAQDAEHAAKLLTLLAPQGVDSLVHAVTLAENDLSALLAAGSQGDIEQARSCDTDDQPGDQGQADRQGCDPALPGVGATDSVPPEHTLAQARQHHEQAAAELSAAREALHRAVSGTQTAQAQVKWLSDQHAAHAAQTHEGRDEASRQARLDRLQAERASVFDLDAHTRQLRAALDAQHADLIEQDAQRWERSARVARDTHQTRGAAISQLQGKLEQAGTQGVGEAWAAAQADVQRLQRRYDEMDLRARALTLLHERLGAQRDAATHRLFAPLARRLAHYLNLLFPQATVTLSDDFTPSILQRGATQDALARLSFGTQEQLGVLTRLAYADVLQQAGRPTLIVLDDALVHTDDARREHIKRALFDAATRHQILMLTCHGQAWRDMGVILRRI